jgi:hypothetical protein
MQVIASQIEREPGRRGRPDSLTRKRVFYFPLSLSQNFQFPSPRRSLSRQASGRELRSRNRCKTWIPAYAGMTPTDFYKSLPCYYTRLSQFCEEITQIKRVICYMGLCLLFREREGSHTAISLIFLDKLFPLFIIIHTLKEAAFPRRKGTRIAIVATAPTSPLWEFDIFSSTGFLARPRRIHLKLIVEMCFHVKEILAHLLQSKDRVELLYL